VQIRPLAKIPNEEYTQRILAELRSRAKDYVGRNLLTIYLGGGTPALWPGEYLARVIEEVKALFGTGVEEVTIEANPEDCNPKNLSVWEDVGINRVSVGIQSFEACHLETLGRDHSMGDGRRALKNLKEAPFLRSYSADFILGTPESPGSIRGDQNSIVEAAKSNAPHLSMYELTIEEKTVFGRKKTAGELSPLSEDEQVERYLMAHNILESDGFEHYEVSSFCREGHRAQHNSLYWQGMEYMGIGVGAASLRFLNGDRAERATNYRSVAKYLSEDEESLVAEHIELTPEEIRAELLWLGLRTSFGICQELFHRRQEVLDSLVVEELVEIRNKKVFPTLKGFLFHNQIAERIHLSTRSHD